MNRRIEGPEYDRFVVENFKKSRNALDGMIRLSKRGCVEPKVFRATIGHIADWPRRQPGT